MDGDSLIQREIGNATALFMVALGQRPEEASNLDLVLTLEDGSRWSATVLTLAEVDAIWKRWERTGECFSGRYFNCPDLLLVREAGIDSICEVLEDVLATGGPEGVLVRLEGDGAID
ncbi:hypothetical protein CTZ28_32750 [Streptomyces shenzhenensis]|uniref:Uncharacterized protein n=1 Tax=Streptomyces shenzhenensis TaxID=943815 RepID=A0A3M0I536_9ACTN|nr:hypothetical protein CTZ28_32750 [Streptomyces shenzhenensis]